MDCLPFATRYGIRPLIIGVNESMGGTEYLVASESVALEALGFRCCATSRRARPSSSTRPARFHSRQCAEHPQLTPCIFEFVYLARPDSVIDGTSVYESRLRMGGELANKIASASPRRRTSTSSFRFRIRAGPRRWSSPITLGLKYREGFVKNRYIGRTFIMPGQAIRAKAVRQKLNPIGMEFKDQVVLLVDDSIVRGTTSREIVQMARDAGARKVYFASASPPVRFPNVYGIDMPNAARAVATGRTEAEIAHEIGADLLIYQDLRALKRAIRSVNPTPQGVRSVVLRRLLRDRRRHRRLPVAPRAGARRERGESRRSLSRRLSTQAGPEDRRAN